jgi:hypothetical protein
MISEDLGIKLENVTLAMLGAPRRCDREGEHHDHRRRRQEEGHRRHASRRSRRRSKRPLRTTTVRSSRSVWPSSLAASRSSASAARPRSKSRRRRTASTTPCTRPARRSKKASCRAAASLCCALRTLKKIKTAERRPEDRRRDRPQGPVGSGRQIVDNAGDDGAVIVGKLLETGLQLRLQLRRPASTATGQEGHHRPDQGRACSDPGRGFDRRPADHHRGDDRRAAQEGLGVYNAIQEKDAASFLVSADLCLQRLGRDLGPVQPGRALRQLHLADPLAALDGGKIQHRLADTAEPTTGSRLPAPPTTPTSASPKTRAPSSTRPTASRCHC